MFVDSSALKELLISARVGSRVLLDDLEQEAKEKGMSLSERVLAEGLISGDDLRRLEAKAAGVPFVSAWTEEIPYTVLAKIPEPIARAHNVIALRESDGGLEVIGLDLSSIMMAGDLAGHKSGLRPRLGSENLVRKLLLSYQKSLRHNFGDSLRALGSSLKEEKSERDLAEIIGLLFGQARASSADQLHLNVSPEETVVSYRIGSQLFPALSTNPYVGSRMFEATSYTDLFAPYGYEPTYRSTDEWSKRAVFVRKDKTSLISLDAVGIWGEGQKAILKTLKQGGLMTVGSASSTNLKDLFYTIALQAADRGLSVLMLEKQRERYLNHVEQVLVGGDGLAPDEALRRLLPQDYDVVLVDEAVSAPLMTLAASAAARGLAVFVGLPESTSDRLISKTIELVGDSYIVSAVATGFMLVDKVRELGVEGTPSPITEQEIKDLGGFVNIEKISSFLNQEGLMSDQNSLQKMNFKVRRSGAVSDPLFNRQRYVAETILVDKLVATMLADGKKPEEIVKKSKQGGVLSLAEDVFAQAAVGKVDLNEAIALVRRAH